MKYFKSLIQLLLVLLTLLILPLGRQLSTFARDEIILQNWQPKPSGKIYREKAHWILDGSSWLYVTKNQKKAAKTWMSIDGSNYYFDENGHMVTGWLQLDDTWYFLDDAGKMQTGWLDDEGNHYYFNETGAMVTGWQTIDGEQYHFEDEGALSKGWILINGQHFFINDDGRRHIGWLADKGSYYYLDQSGVMQTGWLKDNKAWFYLKEDGSMSTGWQTVEGKKYFFDSSGNMKTGWHQEGSKWYYLGQEGDMQKGWLHLNEGTFYLRNDGVMHTGYLIEGTKVAWFNSKGHLDSNHNRVKKGSKIALTFSNGPSGKTSSILDSLQANNAKASFFVVGKEIQGREKILKRISDLGCQVGNHTYDNKNLMELDAIQTTKQLQQTDELIQRITGKENSIVRPPGGNITEDKAASLNKAVVLWSLDSGDSSTTDPHQIVIKVLDSLKTGDIISLHDNSKAGVQAAQILIPSLRELGYDLVTVDQLASSRGEKLLPGKIYHSFG